MLKSDLSQDKKKKLFSDVVTWAGDVKKSDVKELGEKKFSYPIKSNLSGEYAVVEFEAETLSDDLGRRLEMNDDVLRHLIVRDN